MSLNPKPHLQSHYHSKASDIKMIMISLCPAGFKEKAIKEVEELCPHLHRKNITVEVNYPWSFYDALFFSMTVTTTIGKSVCVYAIVSAYH